MKQISVLPYDPNWPKLFKVEAAIIKKALSQNFIAIHHIGSTSVPGLPAKPKIDIIAVAKDLVQSIPALEKVGYIYKGEWNIPFKFGFAKRDSVDVNLHVFEENHPEIELNLIFRDFLRNNSDVRDEYAALKEKLLTHPSSFEKENSIFTGYNLGKDAFIRRVLKEAGFSRIRFLKCVHLEEWSAAKRLCPKETFDAENLEHLVLYQGVEIVGYTQIQLGSDDCAILKVIVIDKNKRSQGLGGQFLDLIEKWVKTQNAKSLHTQAHEFFKKQSYSSMPFTNDFPLEKLL